MRKWILLLVALALLLPLAPALPDEARGIVIYVIDGDTINVQGYGSIRLADVNSPELTAPGGPEAKEYTRSQLLNKSVYLDLDNKTGQDRYGRKVCVVYLSKADGSLGANFNRLLVDSGHAIVEDARDNEFDPMQWWPQQKNSTLPGKENSDEKKFVGSVKSDKYHYPDCRWAKKISPENEIWFSGSEDARGKGYVPCGVCHPP
jgi:micrococcal nuclease